MKLAIFPEFDLQHDKGEGGIKRVVEALHKHLPSYDVEIIKDFGKADVINVHADWLPTYKPVAYSSHGLYWAGYEWPAWAIEANAKLIHAMRYAHSMSVPSQFVHNVFARGALHDPYVLMHGIELEEWEPQENLGYVFWGKTRVDPICSPDPINAVARLCTDLSFVSTFGDELPNLTLTGHMTYARTKSILQHAGVYLATTKETGGITVLEAMASGIPPVGYRWGVNPEIIEHGITGWLVDPDDIEGLQEGIRFCLAHRDTIGENARQAVIERHQWKDRVGDYLPFYADALANSQPHQGPKVSIIVTAYNLESYLPACLDSVLNQKYDSWECIVVDDNSPDNCGKIAREYAEKDSRFKLITNPTNAYLAEARNIAIRSAAGKYILPLDADDMLGEDTLQILAYSLDTDAEKDVVFGAFELIEPNGEHWVSTWPPDNPSYDMQINYRNQAPYSSMYRKWVWERTGGYRRRWRSAEDAEFWTRAMSYGAVPAKVTNRPTLVYNNRPSSMSHSIPTPNWTAWFPWSYKPSVTPFVASGTIPNDRHARPVLDYDPAQISVVIPCGPNHDVYLQDTLDSLVAQTFQNWEAIVVNDTGKKWLEEDRLINPYLQGYPFVKVLDCETEGVSVGPAAARNRGIEVSKAPLFVLLDADDYLQPLALDYMLRAYKEYGGWIYTDFLDELGNHKESRDFDWDEVLVKMPGPITGLYAKKDWQKVGGFDTKITYWEDYSFLLSLMEIGRCGVRLHYPAFTYRYDRGNRRNWTHEHAAKALEEIRIKHFELIVNNRCREEETGN